MRKGKIGFNNHTEDQRPRSLRNRFEDENFRQDVSIIMEYMYHKGKFNTLGHYVKTELNSPDNDLRYKVFEICLDYENEKEKE